MENPLRVDPLRQSKLTPYAKIRLHPCSRIKMTPVEYNPAGVFS